MAYPTKYTRQYDFQSYQNANPNNPLPGDKVNADLNAVVSSIDGIVEFQKLIQDSEGTLANGSVGVLQLDPVLKALIAAATSVDLDDLVNIATQAEAEAGVSNVVLMTPLRVAQFSEARGAQVFTPEMFGAVGDAVPTIGANGYTDGVTGTDDVAAINSCLAAAAAAGAKVEVDKPHVVGISSGSAGVVYPDGLSSLRFVGKGKFILKDSTRAHVLCLTDLTKPASILNPQIDGNKGAQDSEQETHGIRVDGCTAPIFVLGGDVVNTAGYGCSADDSQDVTWFSVHTDQTDEDGIDTHNTNLLTKNVKVLSCLIENFGYKSASKAGIHIRGAGSEARGNTVRDAGTCNGIVGILAGNGETVLGQSVVDNYIAMGTACTGATAISINNPDTVISRNRIVLDPNHSLDAVVLHAARPVASDNRIYGAGRDGMVVDTGADFASLSGNLAYGCAGDGFQVEADNATLTDCVGSNCTGYACRIVSGASDTRLFNLQNDSCTAGRLSDAGTDTVDGYDPAGTTGRTFQNTTLSGTVTLSELPTADPHVAGQVWSNAGVLTVSAG